MSWNITRFFSHLLKILFFFTSVLDSPKFKTNIMMTLEISQENKEQNMCTEGLGVKTRVEKKSSCEDGMTQHLD